MAVFTAPVPAPVATTPAVTSTPAGAAAVWRNARQPGASLIVAADGRAGLYAYGLEGRPRQYLPAGRFSAVDLRADAGEWAI